SRRYKYGDAGGSGARDEGRVCADRAMTGGGMHSEETKQWIERIGIMPVLRARSEREGHALVEALVAGGITVMEVTMTVPGAVDLLRLLKKEFGSKLLLGSGTVTDAAQAEA